MRVDVALTEVGSVIVTFSAENERYPPYIMRNSTPLRLMYKQRNAPEEYWDSIGQDEEQQYAWDELRHLQTALAPYSL